MKVNRRLGAWEKKLARAYVSFNLINYNSSLPKSIFIHECVHIWQYQQFGSVYILRALQAQRSKAGYDYGGVEALYSAMISRMSFMDFNFEQQGQIFEDYSSMILNETDGVNHMNHATYRYFVSEVSG